jgi:hypothetical protein
MIATYQKLSMAKTCIFMLPSCLLPFTLTFMWDTPQLHSLQIFTALIQNEKRQNYMSVDDLIPRWEGKIFLYVLCISYDQKYDFPAVIVLQKYIFPMEQICFHSVPIEMICWFWSTPGPESGRELFRWLPWFEAVLSLGILNSKLSPCKSQRTSD